MNYAARWQLVVDRDVHKAFQRIPKKDVDRVLSAIAELAANPYSGDVSKMRGEKDAWRRRIGAYRLFYEVLPKSRIVHVFALEPGEPAYPMALSEVARGAGSPPPGYVPPQSKQ